MTINENVAALLDKDITFTKGNYTSAKQLSKKVLGTDGLMIKYIQGMKRRNVRWTVNNTPIPTPILQEHYFAVPRAVIESFQNDIKSIYKDDKIEKLKKEGELVNRGMKEIELILDDIKEEKIKLPEEYSLEAFKTALKYGDFEGYIPYYREQIAHLLSRKELLDKIDPMKRERILAMELQEMALDWQYRKLD